MENKHQKVSIVGYGNVGSHLAEALCNAGIVITHICTQNKVVCEDLPNTSFVTDLQVLPIGQLTLICVHDGEIENILSSISIETPVVYTSGSVKLDTLSRTDHLGVFYPLQTFTKGIPVDITKVPFFIESNSEAFGEELYALASSLSSNVKYATSEERAKLHLAAVWVNNFTNHINFIAKDYLDGQQLDFEDLKPLLKETIRKIEMNSPFEVQTGPARRGDKRTIEQHLKMLEPKRQEIFQLLSESILNTYKKNDKL